MHDARPRSPPTLRGKLMRTQKLGVLEKIGFGTGDMAVNAVMSSMMPIITFFGHLSGSSLRN